MDILVLALILICAVAGVHFLLNDKPKAATFSLLPIPALAILSNQLGISGLYPFIAFVCVCVMFFEFLLVRQLNAGKRVFPVFLLLAVGFVAAVFFCRRGLGMGFLQAFTMASCHYIYFFCLALVLFHKFHKEVAILPRQ